MVKTQRWVGAKINGRENRGKTEKDSRKVKNVLICPHGLCVSGDAHGDLSQKINCLVAMFPTFYTVTEHVWVYLHMCFILVLPSCHISRHNCFCLRLNPSLVFTMRKNDKITLDMQQVQISLDLPFLKQIYSDTLGSILHPIVPCLHGFSPLMNKFEASHGLWSKNVEVSF